MTRGILIAVCGIDGSGKTTQAERIGRFLDDGSAEVLQTKQPTDRYRRDPLVRSALNLEEDSIEVAREMALFAAFDRMRHVREVILPAIARGAYVITDRYVYSSYAYFLARGVTDIDWLRQLNRHVPEPDVTIYLDLDPTRAIERILQRDGTSAKREETYLSRMAQVRNNFLAQPWGTSSSYRKIDGSNPIPTVWEDIRRVLDEVLQ